MRKPEAGCEHRKFEVLAKTWDDLPKGEGRVIVLHCRCEACGKFFARNWRTE